MTFQNTLLKYREEKHGDSKMKDLTTKGLGGVSKIAGFFNIGKTDKTQNGKFGNIQMTGVYTNAGETSVRPKSSLVVTQALIDHYAGVTTPKGKPTQLVISDADYIPDQEYADVEV